MLLVLSRDVARDVTKENHAQKFPLCGKVDEVKIKDINYSTVLNDEGYTVIVVVCVCLQQNGAPN